MSWSGGTFSRVHDWTTDAGSAINIEASRMDAEDDNFATGIDSCIHKGGSNTPTADLPMGGYNHTGVANASALDEYASAADVIDQDLIYYVDTGAADAYVITPTTPAITAYEEGQRFVFRATNANTGASTLNVNALGTKAIQTPDGVALVANMIIVGGIYEVTYDANGNRFVMTSPHSLGTTVGVDVQAYDAGLTDIAGLAVTDGNVIVGDGANWVAESGATARASLGVNRANLSLDTTDSPEFAGLNVGAATDTTISRLAAGQIGVEGDAVFSHDSGTYTSAKVFFSTSAPTTEGSNGDIYFEYTA